VLRRSSASTSYAPDVPYAANASVRALSLEVLTRQVRSDVSQTEMLDSNDKARTYRRSNMKPATAPYFKGAFRQS
jgi:hypothetical protein